MRTIIPFILIIILSSCKKYLQFPTSSNVSTIDSLIDCERLLNNVEFITENPLSGQLSCDEYYVKDKVLAQVSKREQNLYTWQPDIFEEETQIHDYNGPYAQIKLMNEILFASTRLKEKYSNHDRVNRIRGAALFYRAHTFFNLLQLYARPYDSTTAQTDTGIALPLIPDVNAIFSRASMATCYQQIIDDLVVAAQSLPDLPDETKKYKPSRLAARALLARIYLCMHEFDMALSYADSCLQQYDQLLDYNSVQPPRPFQESNPEVIYQAFLHDQSKIIRGTLGTACIIDTVLFRLYDSSDLRKKYFYRSGPDNTVILNNSYTGGFRCFAGLATDELFLIRAECEARKNNINNAMDILNQLRSKRYRQNSFVALTAASRQDAINHILAERRRELAFRGLRWMDLRRLNKEKPDQHLYRLVAGAYHHLPPNDLRYTLPFPDDVLKGSQIVQNPR